MLINSFFYLLVFYFLLMVRVSPVMKIASDCSYLYVIEAIWLINRVLYFIASSIYAIYLSAPISILDGLSNAYLFSYFFIKNYPK